MLLAELNETEFLTDEVIDKWSLLAEEKYQKIAGKRADLSAKLRLTIEEILLRFRDLCGTNEKCSIRLVKNLGGINFEITQRGNCHNPLNLDAESSSTYDILERLNLKPRYSYFLGLNKVTVPAPLKPRKNAMLISVLTGAALAVLTWLLSAVMPDSLRNSYLIPLIQNLFAKLSAIFSALATPLVFFAVISGIYGMGGVSSFGKIGGRLLRRMLQTYLMAMCAMIAIGVPLGLLNAGSAKTGCATVFADLLNLVLDIIPSNLISPFQIDNDLQVITIAVFVGVIMLILGERIRGLRSICDEIGTLVNQMMAVVCKTLPLFVYLGLSNMFLGTEFEHIAKVSRIFIISIGGAIITISLTIIRTLLITKMPFSKLFSAQLPALLINLTTSSQVSAMPESMKCCKERWGVDEKFTDFSLPLGIVIYMPNGAIMLGAIA